MPARYRRHALWQGLCLLCLCLAPCLLSFSSIPTSTHGVGTDDAYISFRYARNFAEGHGLVYNPGEHVEGYSNLLYVLFLASAFRLGVAHLYEVSIAVNTLCALLLWAGLCRHARHHLGPGRAVGIGWLLCAWPGLWFATTSGMETVPVLLCQVLVLCAAEDLAEGAGAAVQLCAVSVVLCLLRPDGFILPALACAYLTLRGRRREAALVAAVLFLTEASLVAFRLYYYGYPLPNTYYAKVSGPLAERLSAAGRQLAGVALHEGLLPYLVVLLFSLGSAVRRGIAPSFPSLAAAGWLGYYAYVGGDALRARFLLVLYPLGIYALVGGLRPVLWENGRRHLAGLLLCVQLMGVVQLPRLDPYPLRYDCWVTLGRFLRRVAGPDQVLAICAAGKVPYYAGLRTIDMLGLNDAVIGHRAAASFTAGHNKFDADYVLRRRPDYIATWIGRDLNMSYGLGRARYEAAGYRPRYLINTRLRSQGEDILDVAGRPESVLITLIGRGYDYAVLER